LAELEQEAKRAATSVNSKSAGSLLVCSLECCISTFDSAQPIYANSVQLDSDPFKSIDPFETTNDLASPSVPISHGSMWNKTNQLVQYRALYDYASKRADELSMATGDLLMVS
jgi:hypothetical protein